MLIEYCYLTVSDAYNDKDFDITRLISLIYLQKSSNIILQVKIELNQTRLTWFKQTYSSWVIKHKTWNDKLINITAFCTRGKIGFKTPASLYCVDAGWLPQKAAFCPAHTAHTAQSHAPEVTRPSHFRRRFQKMQGPAWPPIAGVLLPQRLLRPKQWIPGRNRHSPRQAERSIT